VILRGGATGTNYDAESVQATATALEKAGLAPGLMVDCSHGNSSKDFRRQPEVARVLAEQLAGGQRALIGAMLESNLVEGNQEHVSGQPLTYGQSITDACMSWTRTAPLFDLFAQAVRARRRLLAATA
jgi:3-deoxy-7-phosphoheptulonate synthase